MLKTIRLLLPALVPSWRFFDTIAPSPRIEFTLAGNNAAWQEFRPRPAHLPPPEILKRLFWNPCWNESLFLVSCAERVIENPAGPSALEIKKRIHATIAPQACWQFRLASVSREGGQLQKHIIFVSPVYAP